MNIRILLALFLLKTTCLGENIRASSYDKTIQNPADDIIGKSEILARNRRGLGSLIITGTSILVKITAMGLSLSTVLSSGCSYHQSICDNRGKIERMTKEIKTLSNKYELEYAETKAIYFNLKTVTTNNGYIHHYVTKILQTIESLQNIEKDLSTALNAHLPNPLRKNTPNKNSFFEQYLRAVLEQTEARLSDIADIALENKDILLISYALQYVMETSANRFLRTLKATTTNTTSDQIVLPVVKFLLGKIDASKIGKQFRFLKNIKLVPKLIPQIAKSFGKSVISFGKDIIQWKPVKSWENFKIKLKNLFREPVATLGKIRGFVRSKVKTQFVKDYKLTWTGKIMAGIGILYDVITQIVAAKKWNAVATKMEEARKDYETYYTKLQNEFKTLQSEKQKMEMFLIETVDIFKNISQPFKSLLANASRNNLLDVLGLQSTSLGTNNPFFTINFNHVDKVTLKSAQTNIIQYLRDIDIKLSHVKENMSARRTLYQHLLEESEKGQTLSGILSSTKMIFGFSPSSNLKSFGDQLTLKDIVCTMGILRMDLNEYDFYSLEQFRPTCKLGSTDFEKLKSLADVKRKEKLMQSVVSREVTQTKSESLSRLLSAVRNAYTGIDDMDLRRFGSSLTERDIVCVIAKIFKTKYTYDFIRLQPFRPDCNAVSETKFEKMIDAASKERTLESTLRSYLDICNSWQHCPCLYVLANELKVQENEIIQILKQINQQWMPNKSAMFCGPRGCSCNHL